MDPSGPALPLGGEGRGGEGRKVGGCPHNHPDNSDEGSCPLHPPFIAGGLLGDGGCWNCTQ